MTFNNITMTRNSNKALSLIGSQIKNKFSILLITKNYTKYILK